jgi:hypothetical protein
MGGRGYAAQDGDHKRFYFELTIQCRLHQQLSEAKSHGKDQALA